MKLSPLAEKFIVHFGEMGSRWGINRTAARVFALLYLSSQPLHANEICTTLSFSRSYVSGALKELQGWRLITMSHMPGDLRDHFSASDNVWEIARTLVEERQRREIEPTLNMLAEAVAMKPTTDDDQQMHTKIKEMHKLVELITSWYKDVQHMETQKVVRLLKIGSGIYSMYSKASRPQEAGKKAWARLRSKKKKSN